MSKTIALDPGHGADTPGKRSPDGLLREYEFNGTVALLTKKLLEKYGFKVVLTRPCTQNDKDVSLSKRCSIANRAKADLFISIHANASGSSWNAAAGYETYIVAKGGNAEKVANLLVKYADNLGVVIRQPAVKIANFYVLRKTKMPAVLIEHAFMTNKEDCAKLRSSEFREKAATHIARAVCEYFGVAWKEEPKPAPAPKPPAENKSASEEFTLEKLVLPYNGPMPPQPGALWYGDGYQGEGLYFRKKSGRWVKIA